MVPRILTLTTLLVLLHGGNARAAPRPTTPGGLPPVGVELTSPALSQLRPLLGRVLRITLTDGKQITARLLSAWPGVLRVAFPDGQSAAVARRRIRSVTYLGATFAPLATRDAADSGRLFGYLGLGLSVGGLVLGGALAPPLFYVGNRQGCPGILDCVPPATTAAIFVTALSASALAAGVPLWIAGVVRRKVHGRTGPPARRARHLYRSWGMGLTLAGAGLAGLGAALLGVGLSDTERLGGLRWAGAITGPLGVFISLCIGLPMWVEAVRKGAAATVAPAAGLPDPRGHTRDIHHLHAWSVRHGPRTRGVSFAYAWRY